MGVEIQIIGAGYVGCVSAACFAKLGHRVTLVDTEPFKVNEINAGRSPVVEPGLDALVKELAAQGQLKAAIASEPIPESVQVAFVCVSTPSLKSGGVDTRPMQRVFQNLAKTAERRAAPLTVVIRSTIAPNRLRELIDSVPAAGRQKLRVVANPEFLRETTAIADFERPPMIIIGGDDPAGVEVVASLYQSVDAPVHKMPLEPALLVKYASNAYHALKIAFANEIAQVATSLGADPRQVMTAFAQDRVLNISAAYLKPGFAFGGSCLPKDVRALVALGRETGEPLALLRGVLESNRLKIETTADRVAATGAKRIALLGLTFKLGTDDVRESPYVLLAEHLVGRGLEVRVFDPELALDRLVGANQQYLTEHLPQFAKMLTPTLDTALEGAEATVVCKRVLPKTELAARLSGRPNVFDLEYAL
jgi:GDP-mannose 6-dehydrogenase